MLFENSLGIPDPITTLPYVFVVIPMVSKILHYASVGFHPSQRDRLNISLEYASHAFSRSIKHRVSICDLSSTSCLSSDPFARQTVLFQRHKNSPRWCDENGAMGNGVSLLERRINEIEWLGHVKRRDETDNIQTVVEVKMEGSALEEDRS